MDLIKYRLILISVAIGVFSFCSLNPKDESYVEPIEVPTKDAEVTNFNPKIIFKGSKFIIDTGVSVETQMNIQSQSYTLIEYNETFSLPVSQIEIDLNKQKINFGEIRSIKKDKFKRYCTNFIFSFPNSVKENRTAIEACPSESYIENLEKKVRAKCLSKHLKFLSMLTHYQDTIQIGRNVFEMYCSSKAGIDQNKYSACWDEVHECFDVVRL
ncbi:hypothetical protein CH370_14575 [Leptospira kmetyi]|uniref:hypothetical protein n=1 Tax=Leptospira kmetyi TaxID=408139 RepID=UPI000C2A5490|nr:hypothetical protein [Leptospira kmetyi]PJZ40962.1 hypothetical protein CH370_14575 [Leptospira kmetyi]